MNTEYRLSSKKLERNVLQTELSDEELWDSDALQRLEREIQELEETLED